MSTASPERLMTIEEFHVLPPDENPRMLSGDDELTAEPHLPGFTTRLTRVFER